jgi:soluble lytic murein transglycosylase-like protein
MTSRSSKIAAAALGATAAAGAPAIAAATTYIVRPGDTLSEIAVRHGSSVQALIQANNLHDANLIRVGQLLQIPDTSAGLPGYTRAAGDAETYTVRAGDGLFKIARAYGVDPTTLARANGIGVNATLARGAVLHIPGRLARANALLTHTAQEVGVDPRLVRAVAWMESGWQQGVVSPTGAVGMMQIEPYTGDWVSRYLAGRQLDLHVAADNVLAGCLLLNHLLQIHHGDSNAALAAYYQGDNSIARHGLYDDTKQYQHVVGGLMRRE